MAADVGPGPSGRGAPSERPTIFAVATGTPDGPLAVIRISGEAVGRVARELWGGHLPPERRLVRRDLDLGAAGREEALVVYMGGPRSFTGEDVLELHVHGGSANVASVLERLGGITGLEPAGPGEFSRRAFEHGRMSLDRAEGIAAVVGARTDAELRAARRLAAGVFGRDLAELSAELLQLVAAIEGSLDFPEDVDASEVSRWTSVVDGVDRRLRRFLDVAAVQGKLGHRPRVVFAGPPNAGKSSLVNALLGRTRVLVSPEAGTTRDVVEVAARVGGRDVLLVDTAGVRDVGVSAVEAAGIAMGASQIEAADVVVWVEAADANDGSPPPGLEGQGVVWVENKRDLGTRRAGWIGVSATQASGLDVLASRIAACLGGQEVVDAVRVLPRHVDCIEAARRALADARHALSEDLWDVGAWELRRARAEVERIRGGDDAGPVGADVLDAVFAGFCIGK